VTRSEPSSNIQLSENDLGTITKFIRDFKFETITFSGGEPFLNKELVETILKDLKKYQPEIKVRIATNALFASNEEKTFLFLKSLPKIDKFIVSFDEYHGNKIHTEKCILNLKKVCKKLDIKLKCFIVKKTPFFVSYVSFCEDNKLDYEVFLLNTLGRAFDSSLGDEYLFKPVLKDEDLSDGCDLVDNINFYPEIGFTNCCSNLIFKENPDDRFYSSDITNYLDSNFYNTIQNTSILKMAKSLCLESLENYESKCDICEEFFRKSYEIC